METDLIIPILWTILITSSLFIAINKIKNKKKSQKLWIRKDEPIDK